MGCLYKLNQLCHPYTRQTLIKLLNDLGTVGQVCGQCNDVTNQKVLHKSINLDGSIWLLQTIKPDKQNINVYCILLSSQ